MKKQAKKFVKKPAKKTAKRLPKSSTGVPLTKWHCLSRFCSTWFCNAMGYIKLDTANQCAIATDAKIAVFAPLSKKPPRDMLIDADSMRQSERLVVDEMKAQPTTVDGVERVIIDGGQWSAITDSPPSGVFPDAIRVLEKYTTTKPKSTVCLSPMLLLKILEYVRDCSEHPSDAEIEIDARRPGAPVVIRAWGAQRYKNDADKPPNATFVLMPLEPTAKR